jgi:hypothetical protein
MTFLISSPFREHETKKSRLHCQEFKSGVVEHFSNPSTYWRLGQEDLKFEASLGYTVKP